MISLVVEDNEEYSFQPVFPVRTGVNVLCTTNIVALFLKHRIQKKTGLSWIFLNDRLEKQGEKGRVMMENSIVETNNEHSRRKEQLHGLSGATIS